jgi:PAS domain S-box-containing protein
MVDNTDHKIKEGAAQQYRNRLMNMVDERTRELKKSEATYRKMVEDMQEIVCRFLPDGTITFVNRACRKQLGIEVQQLVGENFFRWISPDADDTAEKDFKTSIQKNRPMSHRLLMKRHDGSSRWIRWSGYSLLDTDGSLLEYQALGRDITHIIKEREHKIQHEKWHRRTQKLEAIGTLSAGIAHDFNNIVAVILGNVQLAMDDVSKETRTRKNLDEIYGSCLRARDMIKQILTFAREGDQEMTALSFVPVVKESIKFLRSAIPSTIEIREDIQETGAVKADPTQIGQVIMNLGANAAYAMGSEPGTLHISMKNIMIDHGHKHRFRVPGEGKYVKLDVVDTGCGMNITVASRVFDPYFTTKKEGEGSGMGLAVVHGIIENHGGIIWVESEPGKGSAFHMLFPTVETAGLEPEIEHPQPALKGSERVLVVDDEEALLEAEMDMLERLGYEVTGTTSPVEALELFRRQPYQFDLIYTDMTMPGMTGLSLAKKTMEIRPLVPVILYSGHTALKGNNEVAESGIKAFLTKPIILEDLASTIREVLDDSKRKQF